MFLRVLVALAVWPAMLWAGDSTNASANVPPIVPVDPNEVTLANQLLTPELAASILGVQVTRDGHRLGTSTHAGGVSHVAYTGVSPSELHISLLIRRAGSLKENDQVYGKARTVSQGVAVPGFGDDAFLTKEHVLEVRDGCDWLVISAGTFAAPDLAAQERAARAILKALHGTPPAQASP